MAKTLLISVVLFSIRIVSSNLTDSSPSVGQPCNKVNETVADKRGCEIYLICNIDNEWSNRSCSFPFLFSDTEKLCQDFNNVTCGGRREPRSPCMYTGESEARCSYIPQRTICQCVNTMDLNFDMCVNLSDGLYAWPSRKLSRYYIQCLKGRTLPMMCEGSSMVFDFQEKHCLLVYDEVSRLYNHTVIQPESTFASVSPLNVYVTRTRFVHDMSLQQSTSGLYSDYLTSGADGNSVGKQTFVPAFSQFIVAAFSNGDVTQTNLVHERSLLFQQSSSVCVTNTQNSKFEKSFTIFNSYVAAYVPPLSVDMTQTQFVPEKYTLLQTMDGTISVKPSTLDYGAFKYTSEIYQIHVEPFTSSIQNHFTIVPDSTMDTLFPVSNTLLSPSSFVITASLSTNTCILNSDSSGPVLTPPNRITKALTLTTTITNHSENSSGKHHWFDDFSSCQTVNIPLPDQTNDSKSPDFLEMSVINNETYLSAGRISNSEIISTPDYTRDSDVVENSFFQHLNASNPISEIQGPLATNYLQLTKTYYFSQNLKNTVLGRSFYEAETKQVQYLTMSEHTQGNFGITTYGSRHFSSTLGNNSPSSSAAKQSTEFTTKHPSVMRDNTFILRTSAFLTTSETYFDRLSFRSQSQMLIFIPKASANRGISRQNDPSLFMPSDFIDMGTGFSASTPGHQYGHSNTISIRPDDTEIKVSRYFSSNLLSQIPKSSAQTMLSISILSSTISSSFKIYSSQLNSLPTAILESTVSTNPGQSFVIRDESDQGLSTLPLKASSHVSMQSKMSPHYQIKTVDRYISSSDQLGYLSLKPSSKLESRKATFSAMNSMAQFISKVTDSIQPTKANLASNSSIKPTEAVKPNVDTIETKMTSSEASIFLSNLAMSRSSSMPPMSMTRDLMRSELILDSSFIPVTPVNFPALLNKSATTVMGTYSLLRLFESLHSTILEYSSSQAIAFGVSGPSSRSAVKISPRSTPVTYDSQLSPLKMLEISPSQAVTWLATSIISTSSSSVEMSKANASSLISLTDMISSSAPYTSNSQSIESTKSKQNDSLTKSITSTKDQELNPLNLSNTSFIAVLVGSCAGLLFFILLTTILVIHLRKRTKRRPYLQSG